jgi:hypothetical protein
LVLITRFLLRFNRPTRRSPLKGVCAKVQVPELEVGILGIKDELFHRFVDNYKGHDLNEGVDIVSELSSSVLGPGTFSQRSAPGSSAAIKVDAVSRAISTTSMNRFSLPSARRIRSSSSLKNGVLN